MKSKPGHSWNHGGWPHGSVCPHCQNTGDKRISKLEARGTSPRGVRQGVFLWRLHGPFSKWQLALLCSSKKSLSANQAHRMLGVTYKTAWFLCHRIRFGMTPQQWAEAKLQHGGGQRDLRRARGDTSMVEVADGAPSRTGSVLFPGSLGR